MMIYLSVAFQSHHKLSRGFDVYFSHGDSNSISLLNYNINSTINDVTRPNVVKNILGKCCNHSFIFFHLF